MTKTEHDQRQEVLSIVMSNLASGLAGGVPATAALARTALNIKSGASSRLSGLYNAFGVLLLGLFFLPFFKFIPMATVASLLVMIAIRMVAVDHLVHMYKFDRSQFYLAMLSGVVCFVVDTMAGILVGAVISLLLFTEQMSVGHTEIQLSHGNHILSEIDPSEMDQDKEHTANELAHLENIDPKKSADLSIQDLSAKEVENMNSKRLPSNVVANIRSHKELGDTIVYRFTGQLTYVNAVAHCHRIKRLAEDVNINCVVLSLRFVWYIDLDGIDALKEMVDILEANSIRILFSGVIHGNVATMLDKHPFFQNQKSEHHLFASYLDALNSLEH
jgi:MFS superfamily sulfate permease-like transporter